MPIVTGDIHLRLSTTAGSAGNTTAQANPNASLGKYVSTTDIVDATLNNLFDNISGDENAAGTTDYRCVFVYNAHSTLTLQGTKVWVTGPRFTAANAGDVFTSAAHGFANGDTVRLEAEYATDTLPTGSVNSTTYYIVGQTTNTFQIALTAGGSAVVLTSDGSGAVRKYSHTTCTISIDNAAASAVGASPAQAETIASETAVPSAVGAFSGPTTKSGGLSLGNIGPGQCRAFWVKRVALNTAAFDNDGISVRAEGDTSA